MFTPIILGESFAKMHCDAVYCAVKDKDKELIAKLEFDQPSDKFMSGYPKEKREKYLNEVDSIIGGQKVFQTRF